jgi:PAS domain S-box-containing protein
VSALRSLHLLGLNAAVVAAYVASAVIGFRLAFVAEQVTTVWAPTGIAMAALLVGGIRLWPAIWVGALLANVSTDAPAWTAVVIASGNTLEAVAAVWWLRRLPDFGPGLRRVADVLAFVVIAAVACTAISATVGVATLCAAGVQPWERFSALWFDWWLGDALGALVVAPAILTTLNHEWSRREWGRALPWVAGSIVVTHLVFGQRLAGGLDALEYAVFPLVIGAALFGGPPLSSLAVLGVSVVAIWHTVHGTGPFASSEVHRSLILLQAFMGILSGTSLLLAAAMAERVATQQRERGAATELRHREEMLRLAQRAGGVATFEWDVGAQVTRGSAEFFRMLGLPAQDGPLTAADWERFVHPDDRERLAAHVTRALEGVEPAAADFRINAVGGATRWLSYAGQIQQTPAGERMLGTVVDISDRKRGEMALQRAKAAAEEGQQRLAEANRELALRVREQQTLLDVLPIGIGIAMDRECRHIRTNRAFAQTLGLPPDTNASKTAPLGERPTNFRILTPTGTEVRDDALPMQVAAREGREIRDVELDIAHHDGRVVRLLEYAAPLMDEHGTPRGAVGAFVDVTAAQRARETLVRSEARYRRIFETAGVSLWEEDFSAVKAALDRLRGEGITDLGQYLATHPEFVDHVVTLVKIVDVNEATLRMFRAPDKATLLEALDRIFRPETRDIFAGELLAFVEGARQYEVEAALQTLDGRPLDVVVTVAFPEPGDIPGSVLVSLADITDRKRAETALRQEVEVRTTLAAVGATLAGELRSDKLIQAITDTSTRLTEAEFGAFFYHLTDEGGDVFVPPLAERPGYALSGFSDDRATQIAAPAFRGDAIIRVDDLTEHPWHAVQSPFDGRPGDLPVRSYLAVPVIGRNGVAIGGLFFGHSRPGMFSERHQLLASGVAAWAAIAIDNARLYQDAQEANRLKDEFLATLSHELRTPLNAVLGWAHMLREGTLEPPMQQRALESLERNARAQAQLVDDLLDVSRIMAGKLQLKAEAVDLGAVIVNAVDTVRAGVTAKRLDLQLHFPPDRRVVVTGDADRLQQVVWNLVSNAVKFTPSGGRVDVELRQVESRAEIVVRDTGPGIEPSFRPHLFERFRQMNPAKARVYGGLGLGLSIVRHLVEAHGGTVAVESDGDGRGATFCVALPLRAVDEIRWDRPGLEAETPDQTLAGVRALVVDDEDEARELTRQLLDSRGAAVVTTRSAGEALHLLAQEPFTIVIADIGMPEQDGLSLIRAVRALPSGSQNRDVPAIALAADAFASDRDEALAAGFTGHVGKPVDPQELVAAIAATTVSISRQADAE